MCAKEKILLTLKGIVFVVVVHETMGAPEEMVCALPKLVETVNCSGEHEIFYAVGNCCQNTLKLQLFSPFSDSSERVGHFEVT